MAEEDEDAPQAGESASTEGPSAKANHQETQIRFLLECVRDEAMTPSKAESYANGLGLKFGGQTWTVSIDEPYWPLAFAILWISWRDPEHTLEQWDRFRTWAGELWRDPQDDKQPVSLQDAEAQLWRALKAGTVQAVGLPDMKPNTVEIPSIEWLNLEWMPNPQRISVRNFAYSDAAYRCVDVRSLDVLALWPVAGTAAIPKPVNKNQGGRATIHDWAAAAGYMAGYVVENDYPATQAVMVQATIKWFDRHRGKAPDSRDVERFVKAMYDNRAASGET